MKGEEEKEAGGTQGAASHGVVAPWWHTTRPVPPSCASCPLQAAGSSPRRQPAGFCSKIGPQICPKIPGLQEGTWVPVGPHGCSAPCPASPNPVRAPLAPGRDPGPGGGHRRGTRLLLHPGGWLWCRHLPKSNPGTCIPRRGAERGTDDAVFLSSQQDVRFKFLAVC